MRADAVVEGTSQLSMANLVGPTLDPDLEDEALASAARDRYRTDGIDSIEPDAGMSLALRSDEQLLAVRQTASVERPLDGGQALVSGYLAITSRRVMLIDEQPVTLASFEELDDVTLVSDRLLVTLTSGTGFAISATNPTLLRVQLAEARASWSDGQSVASEAGSGSPVDLPRR
jgi:hypothetical protein